MAEPDYLAYRRGPWYCDWNWCRTKFTNSKELGKHVINHIEEDYKAGILSCRQSDAERLRRALEGLDSVSHNLDSQSQSKSEPRGPVVVTHPESTRLNASPSHRTRSRSHDTDEGERPRKRTRTRSFADVDAGSSPDAEMAPLPDSPDIFAQAQEPSPKRLPPSPSPAAADLTLSAGIQKASKRPWRLPGAVPEARMLTAEGRLSASQKPPSKGQPSSSHEPAIAPAESDAVGSNAQPQSNSGNEYGQWVDGIMSQAPYYTF